MSPIPADLKLETRAPGTAELGLLFERLGSFNQAAVPGWGKQTLSVALRGEGGTLAAGGHAELLLGLAEIRAVWVEESRRGQGLGRAVMEALEAEARERGILPAGGIAVPAVPEGTRRAHAAAPEG